MWLIVFQFFPLLSGSLQLRNHKLNKLSVCVPFSTRQSSHNPLCDAAHHHVRAGPLEGEVRFIMRFGEGTFVFICCRALCLQTRDNDIICSNPSSRPPRRRSMAFCLVFEFATENCVTTAYVVSAFVPSTAHLPTGLSSQVSLYSQKSLQISTQPSNSNPLQKW